MSPEEQASLLELLSVASTVFEEDVFHQSPKARTMALRRLAAAHAKCVVAFSNTPTFGRG